MTNDLNSYDLYCDDIESTEVLTPQEEQELLIRYHNGDYEARNKLVESNLRLVRKLVSKYKGLNISLGDLVQDLSLYLFTVVDNFDLSKGCKLSTYAQRCLKFRLTDYLDRQIKNPLFTKKDRIEFSIINKFYYNYANENGYFPDIETIANNTNFSKKRITYLFNISNCTTSLNGLIDDNYWETMEQDDFENEDVYRKSNYISNSSNFEEEVCSKLKNEALKKLILSNNKLTDIEKRNISMMYGFDDGEYKTCREIGKIYNVSHSAIDCSVKNGIKKIKKIPGIKEFK